MKTKAYVTFLNRVAHYDADLELVDVLKGIVRAGQLHNPDSEFLFDQVDGDRHPTLARRTPTDNGRTIAINHLRATVYSSYLKDLYEDVTAYLRSILRCAMENGLDPGRLIGEHEIKLKANRVLSTGNWDTLIGLVSSSVFRLLENERDTKGLLEKMSKKLNMEVDEDKISAALPFLEWRHFLVHADGVADEKFCQAYPTFRVKPGNRIPLRWARIQTARSAVMALIEEFDMKVVQHGVVSASQMQP